MISGNDAPAARSDLRRYAVIPVWYGCNSSCVICMLAPVRDRLRDIGFETFSRMINALVADGRYPNLILSGAEVTTCSHIEQYVRYAASSGYFARIQIQTNGMRLADKRYLAKLVDAGVNEFFISVHGPEKVHDAITRTPGSHAATMAGIYNLAAFPVRIITNTVLTRLNCHTIVSHLGDLSATRVSELHLWNYFPMAPTDCRDLVVSMAELRKLFPAFAAAIGPSGKPLVLKAFPECLSPGYPLIIDNGFPLNIIQDDFWIEFAANGFGACPHRESCSRRECWGLSRAYIKKYGDEKGLFVPVNGEDAT